MLTRFIVVYTDGSSELKDEQIKPTEEATYLINREFQFLLIMGLPIYCFLLLTAFLEVDES